MNFDLRFDTIIKMNKYHIEMTIVIYSFTSLSKSSIKFDLSEIES